MSIEQSQIHADAPINVEFPVAAHRTSACYERELAEHRSNAVRLRSIIAADEELIRRKDQLIGEQALISQESNHRLLNDLQIVASLLSLQSRNSANAEAGSQLTAAASRIATIARVHRRLHSMDGAQSFAFKQYLQDFCRDFSTLLGTDQTISVEGIDIELPRATGFPLGLIVNELITNAVKYGTGRITVSLERDPDKGYAVSVANDGPALPQGFDPTASKGQGMRIIRSFVDRIGGELRIGRRDNEQGTRFTVLFGGSKKHRD